MKNFLIPFIIAFIGLLSILLAAEYFDNQPVSTTDVSSYSERLPSESISQDTTPTKTTSAESTPAESTPAENNNPPEAVLGGKDIDPSSVFIDLNNTKIDDFDTFARNLELYTALEKIEMCDTGLTNEQMETLQQKFPKVEFIWKVHLGIWSVRTDAVAFGVEIYKATKYERMTSEDIEVLKYCTKLQALDLGHQAIEDISVIGEYLTELRVLILVDNKIKDISPLANLKHLHYLEAFVNEIWDISPLKSCTELVDLNIGYNYFLTAPVLLELPLLERLWLVYSNLSDAELKSIADAHPECKIVTDDEDSVSSGWREHERYSAMIDMFRNNYISEVFSRYDGK